MTTQYVNKGTWQQNQNTQIKQELKQLFLATVSLKPSFLLFTFISVWSHKYMPKGKLRKMVNVNEKCDHTANTFTKY